MQRIPAHVTLRALREMRGLTAAALADRIAARGITVDKQHIYSVELGQRTAGLALRVAWAEELGISPGEIRFDREMRDLIAVADAENAREAAEAAATATAAA